MSCRAGTKKLNKPGAVIFIKLSFSSDTCVTLLSSTHHHTRNHLRIGLMTMTSPRSERGMRSSRRRHRSAPEMSSCQHPQIVCSFRSGSRQAGRRVTLIWTLTQLSSLEWSKWKRWIRFWNFSKTRMSRRKRRRLDDSFSQTEASPSTWFLSSCSLSLGLSVSNLNFSNLSF